MLAEGELRSNLDESDKVRDLQDRLADLKAEVSTSFPSPSILSPKTFVNKFNVKNTTYH